MSFVISPSSAYASSDAVHEIPIQHNGRVKSLDAFSRQTVKLITAKSKWQNQDPVATILEILKDREAARDWEWIRVDLPELKATLGLVGEGHYFSYNQIVPATDKLENLVRSAKEHRDADLRPTKLEQKGEELYSRVKNMERFLTGDMFALLPAPPHGAWKSPFLRESELNELFDAFIVAVRSGNAQDIANRAALWNEAVYRIPSEAQKLLIRLEIAYYRIRPFEWAALFYALGFLLIFAKASTRRFRAGIVCLGLAFAAHTIGLGMRMWILGRPPVSNMYESMVFMNWALAVAAGIFYALRRQPAILKAGAIVSTAIMIYADILPIDSSLEVLVPVLRSTYWLTIHVLMVVGSYGVFALAMGLGHRHLFLAVQGKLSKSAASESADLLLRIIEFGVILIGTGTVLGGVWANESWGRFWGWDPKETWALITTLGYLAIIHLRWFKKINEFQFAFLCVLGFLLVLMTWYGVNFVLGRGLHSYGRGSGGMQWVTYYLIAEAIFLVYILIIRSRNKKS